MSSGAPEAHQAQGTQGALGVIAGTGFYALDDLRDPEDVTVDTAFGPTRARIGTVHDRRTVFISRHGYDHSVPPHMVNYRANIQAMVDLGVSEILAINVVGGCLLYTSPSPRDL